MIAGIIFVSYGFLFWKAARKISKEKIFVFNWLLTPILVFWLVSFIIPMFQPFRLLFTIVPFYLLLAVGVCEMKENLHRLLAAGLVMLVSFVGLGIYYGNTRFQREDWRGAVRYVESQDPNKSVAIFEFSAPFAPYEWYSIGKIKTSGILPGLVAKPEIVESQIRKVALNENIYLFQYLQELTDPSNLVKGWLETNGFTLIGIRDFSGVGFVYNYRKQSL